MIEITTATAKTEVKPFPKLMKNKHTSRIVFFTEPEKGLCLKEGSWHENWNMDNFEDYNEEVTIKNK